jgi:penicillin-binding protein 1C
MKQIGFDSFDQPAGHYGLSIVLGGAESTLWELTAAYAGMARAYQQYVTRPIGNGYSAEDYHPNNYLMSNANKQKTQETQADGYLRAASLGFTFEALQAVNRPDEELGWELFSSSQSIAWKTGTSIGFRDGWAIGLNDQYLIGVWVGNADGEGRPGLTGVKAAAPLLFELFDLVGGNSILQEPFGAAENICAASGMLASKICPETVSVQLPSYLLENTSCSFHRTIHLDATAHFQVNSSCYSLEKIQTKAWFALPPVQSWYYQMYHPEYEPIPPYLADCEAKEGKALFGLIYPSQYSKVHIPVEQDGSPGQTIFEATHENVDAQVHWHLDDNYLGTTKGSHQMAIRAEKGKHLITLIDEQGMEIRQFFEVVE